MSDISADSGGRKFINFKLHFSGNVFMKNFLKET